MSLTHRQAEALDFLRAWFADCEVGPSLSDIAAGLNITSRSQVHTLIRALADKGYIVHHPFRARSIRLAAPPSCAVTLAATRLVESALHEAPEQNVVVVPADLFGALDIALSEARARLAGPRH